MLAQASQRLAHALLWLAHASQKLAQASQRLAQASQRLALSWEEWPMDITTHVIDLRIACVRTHPTGKDFLFRCFRIFLIGEWQKQEKTSFLRRKIVTKRRFNQEFR